MRFWAVILVGVILSSSGSLRVSSAQGHGCAWPTPPAITGTPLSVPPSVPVGFFLINELLFQPHSTWNCSEQAPSYSITNDSWVELYNPQNQPFDLYASHTFIDSGPGTNRYYLQLNSSIAAHGFLILFPRLSPFFLMTMTSTIRLMIADTVIDQVTVPTLGPDQSYIRYPDGNNNWQITNTPTIGSANILPGLSRTPTTTSTGNTSTGNDNSNQVVINGTQPVWNSLQFPTSVATPTVYQTPTNVPSALPLTSSGFALPRQIALTLLSIAFVLTLLWTWKLFSR